MYGGKKNFTHLQTKKENTQNMWHIYRTKKKWIMYKVNLLNNYDWLWSFSKEKINELKYFMYEDKFNFHKS